MSVLAPRRGAIVKWVWRCTLLLVVAAACGDVLGQSPTELIGSRRRATGQPVAPVFEGWAPNPDGTFTMYFGYMNRNWSEDVDIPVGPNNFFEPGPADRGQPTHFLANRQKKNFGVVVPKDFGTRTLVWTLISRGSTEHVPGKLGLIFQIDVTKTDTSAAPRMALGPDQTVVLPEAATISATILDDGMARSGRGGRGGPRLTVRWRQYRGPGRVTFADAAPPIKDGKSVTTVRVSESGVYMFQALAENGSSSDSALTGGIPGFMCCWTTAQMTVTFKPTMER
jgi:hypothetical protein